MELEGGCHCGKVAFKFISNGPYPFMICLCSICRKTNGGGGYSINILGDTTSMKIRGKEHISEYVATEKRKGKSSNKGIKRAAPKSDKDTKTETSLEVKWEPFSTDEESSARSYCDTCHSGLWNYSPEYSEWIYPFASAIDTDLPAVPEIDGKDGRIWIMKSAKASWIPLPQDANVFDKYPNIGLEEWHKKHNLSPK